MDEGRDAANTVNPYIEQDLKKRRETGIDKTLAQAVFGTATNMPPLEETTSRPRTRSTRKRLYENPPESPAKIPKTDKSPIISVPLRGSDGPTNKKGIRKSTVKDVKKKNSSLPLHDQNHLKRD